jgi:hypothetical protein
MTLDQILPMRQYFTYLITGLTQAWLLLFAWGSSAGPATPNPYYSLITALVIWIPASILSLFFAKPAAVLALAAALMSLSIAVAFEGPRMLFSPFELIVAAVSFAVLFKRRNDAWLTIERELSKSLTIALSVVPCIIFMSFNIRGVIALISQGPPK